MRQPGRVVLALGLGELSIRTDPALEHLGPVAEPRATTAISLVLLFSGWGMRVGMEEGAGYTWSLTICPVGGVG